MVLNKKSLFSLLFPLFVASCGDKQPANHEHPWGDDPLEESATRAPGVVTLEEIVSNGEIIVATMSGPDSYYDYRGQPLGTQYLLMKQFAEDLGVIVRVEVCEDSTAVLSKVDSGEADVAMLFFPRREGFSACGAKVEGGSWLVHEDNGELAQALSDWYKPALLAAVEKREDEMLSGRVVTQHAYAYFLNREEGVISQYDQLFRDCSESAGCDWRLLASMCYQESRFDYEAKSFAGACGLMQLMPSTAEHLGLPREEIFNPEKNIATGARYVGQLRNTFRDITPEEERLKFVLAAYNGGVGHIRDAMMLAREAGKNAQEWNSVAPFVLALSDPLVYRQPGVKCGYMRGTETVDYVASVYRRWYDYRGAISGPDIYSTRDLGVDGIINEASQRAGVTDGSLPPGDYSSIDRSADHAAPTPAKTQRRAKYDVE